MPTLVEAVQAAAKSIREDYRDKAVDGWGRDEVFSFMLVSASKVVAVAQSIGGTGEEKKAACVEAINQLYATVIAPLDLPGVPNLLEPAVDYAGGLLVSYSAPTLVEGALSLLKSLRVPGFSSPATGAQQ